MEKKVSNNSLLILPLLYFMLSCILTSEKYRSFFNITLALACGLFVYLFYQISSNKPIMGDELSISVLLIVQIAIIYFSSFFINDSLYVSETKAYLNGLLVLFIMWLAYNILREIDKNVVKVLVRIYLFAIVAFSLSTIYVEFTGPENVIRNTAMGVFYDSNVIYGGYDFIYSIVVVYCALIFYFVSYRTKISVKSKAIIIIALVAIFFAVAFSNYTTALLFIVFFSMVPFFAEVENKVTFIFAVFICVILFFVFSNSIAEFVKSLPLSELTTKRVSNLILSLTGHEGVENSISGEGQRMDRVSWSLKIIAKNPIVGGFVGNTTEDFGYHTEWIDKAARHGLVYMFFHGVFWIKAQKKMLSFSEIIEEKKLIKTAFFVFIILGFFNPIALMTTPAPLFLLCPFLKYVFPVEDR